MDSPSPIDPGRALVPAREQTVDFYGDTIPVAQVPEGDLYVAVGAITTFLGISSRGQRERISRDKVLAVGARMVTMTTPDGKRRATLCLPLHLLPGWLFGIDTSRVKPEQADKLDRYRAECFRVLWNAFQGSILPATPPPSGISLTEQALLQAEALANLARQQLAYEGRLEGVEQKQTVMADYLRPFVQRTGERLTALEIQLGTARLVSKGQAAEIAKAVRAVAGRLGGQAGGNPYQQVHTALYDRFNIFGYENLPAARYEECMAWLRAWYDELPGGQTPEQGKLL